jgi:DNA polymerase I-like protein with 3'-5' exonuclease and polymerase domains
LILRCKKAIAKDVKKITEDIMIESAADLISVPMKVDCDVSDRWFGDKIEL